MAVAHISNPLIGMGLLTIRPQEGRLLRGLLNKTGPFYAVIHPCRYILRRVEVLFEALDGTWSPWRKIALMQDTSDILAVART